MTEIFSPERVVAEAKRHGLSGGLSMDLRTGWDFRRREDRKKAKQYVREVQPLLLIGSPVCTPFSALQACPGQITAVAQNSKIHTHPSYRPIMPLPGTGRHCRV